MITSATLTELGLRKTQARIEVARVFDSADEEHLSAKEVHSYLMAQDISLGFGTVYRVLGDLTNAGFLRKLHIDETHVCYEMNSKKQHDHFICEKSHRTYEIEPVFDCEAYASALAKQGFKVTSYNLVLKGTYSDD